MSRPSMYPRPLREAFRQAMREKPPEVIRNKEFLEELRAVIREGPGEIVGPPTNVEDFIASLHAEAAKRERKSGNSA